jgi:hypothetical protein
MKTQCAENAHRSAAFFCLVPVNVRRAVHVWRHSLSWQRHWGETISQQVWCRNFIALSAWKLKQMQCFFGTHSICDSSGYRLLWREAKSTVRSGLLRHHEPHSVILRNPWLRLADFPILTCFHQNLLLMSLRERSQNEVTNLILSHWMSFKGYG